MPTTDKSKRVVLTRKISRKVNMRNKTSRQRIFFHGHFRG